MGLWRNVHGRPVEHGAFLGIKAAEGWMDGCVDWRRHGSMVSFGTCQLQQHRQQAHMWRPMQAAGSASKGMSVTRMPPQSLQFAVGPRSC